MALSYYATTRPGALSTAMNSSTTVVPLVDAASFPDPAGPGNSEYTVIIGYGSDREEVCTVTAKVGDTLTVIRGQDSTAAVGKNQGDVVVHGVSARDFKSFALASAPPNLHAGSHAVAGLDRVTPASIGATSLTEVNNVVNAAVPIGTIIMWGGASVPTGYHLCDGTAHGSVALQNAIGSPNTPDMRGLFIVGASLTGPNSDPSTGSTTAYPPGSGTKVGKETVTLTTAQMPSHTHSPLLIDAVGLGWGHQFAAGIDYATISTGTTGSERVSAGAAGGGQAHENRPPYYAVTFCIRKA